jgi:hypothetical protein
MEAAQFALRFQPAAQRFYQRKLAKSRNNTVLARKAVAHKFSGFTTLSSIAYSDLGCWGYEKAKPSPPRPEH